MTLKKMLLLKLFFTTILILSLSPGLFSEESMSNVYGKVIDAVTKEPVEGVHVSINVTQDNQNISTSTDTKGEFFFKKFPADSYEYEIYVKIKARNRGADLDARYFNQLHTASFKLPKGKNLILKPIELQPGVRVKGQIFLPDGQAASVGRITFRLATPLESASRFIHWTTVSPITDGSYLSQLLPMERDLIMEVKSLKKESIGYVGVRKSFKLEKGSTAVSMDIEIPDTLTEIKGIVVNRQGNPLANQVVGIYEKCGVTVVTDENGEFCIRSIPVGTTEVYTRYRGTTYHMHFINHLPVNTGESIFLRITVDEGDFFTFLVTRTPFTSNSN
ncbi:MAG: hypothetical protein GY757_05085 [bacterium]|nr:hypothetical protein [bacterium]